ncbi:MAG: hypothetical protein IT453_00745 [Planctomycetes bacterium]|nr:hypothetical protein [Planctomycetota bacterium]
MQQHPTVFVVEMYPGAGPRCTPCTLDDFVRDASIRERTRIDDAEVDLTASLRLDMHPANLDVAFARSRKLRPIRTKALVDIDPCVGVLDLRDSTSRQWLGFRYLLGRISGTTPDERKQQCEYESDV